MSAPLSIELLLEPMEKEMLWLLVCDCQVVDSNEMKETFISVVPDLSGISSVNVVRDTATQARIRHERLQLRCSLTSL